MSVASGTYDGAELSLLTQKSSPMGQWLTSVSGLSPFIAQTAPVRPMATMVQLADFNQTQILKNAAQTFTALVPDNPHYVSGLTVVVGVPAIVNQTQNAVTKHGVNNGVASIAIDTHGTDYDGSAATVTLAAAPSGGVTATATATGVPADVISTAAGINVAIDNPGFGYSSAPAVTFAGGGHTVQPTATATLTAEGTGQNYRFVVPSKSSGGQASALVATNSDAGTSTNLGTAILLESDVSKVHGIVAKAIAGLTYPAAVDSNYHNSIDGGVQDIAPYYMPFCPSMMFEEIVVKTTQNLELFAFQPHDLVSFEQLYTPEGLQLGRYAHSSRDVQTLKAWSAQPNNLWFLRLPCFDVRRPFPIHACPNTQLMVQAKTRPYTELIVNATGGDFTKCTITASGTTMKTVAIAPATTATSLLGSTAPADTALGTAVASTDFSLRLLVDGIVVDDDAAAEMLTVQHKIPITQIVHVPTPNPIVNAKPNQKIAIRSRMPIKSVHWTGVLESNVLRNDYSNFAAPGDPLTATAEFPQGTVPRAIFSKCQLFANGRPLTLKSGPDVFLGREQKNHCLRRPPNPPLHVYSHHFCTGSPYDFQHDAYLGATDVKFLELRVDPDASIFTDNSAVLGLDGTASGTVAGGQKIHQAVWLTVQNFAIVSGGTVSLAFQ